MKIGTRNDFFTFFRDRPTLLPSIFFLSGLWLAGYQTKSAWIPVLLFSGLSLQSPRRLVCLLTIFAAAFWYGTIALDRFPEDCFSLRGRGVLSVSRIRTTQNHFKQQVFVVGTVTFSDASSERKAHRIPCSVKIDPSIRPFTFGKYEVSGALEKTERGFFLIPDPETPWTGIGRESRFIETKYKIQRSIRRFIKNKYKSETVGNFVTALVVGGSSEDRLLRFCFNRLGLQHILAISGFHFGLLSLFVGAFFRSCFRKKTADLLLFVGLTLYFFLPDTSPSIMRAYFAIALHLAGRGNNLRSDPMNLLGATLLLELLFAPESIKNLGFQFSFLATASILILYPPLLRLMKRALPETPFSDPSLPERGVRLGNRFLRSALALNAAVCLTVIPVSLFHFGAFPVIAPVYNLFIPSTVFVTLFLFLLSLPFSALHPIAEPVVKGIDGINNFFTAGVLRIVTESPNRFDGQIRFDAVPGSILVSYLLLLCFLGVGRRKEPA